MNPPELERAAQVVSESDGGCPSSISLDGAGGFDSRARRYSTKYTVAGPFGVAVAKQRKGHFQQATRVEGIVSLQGGANLFNMRV